MYNLQRLESIRSAFNVTTNAELAEVIGVHEADIKCIEDSFSETTVKLIDGLLNIVHAESDAFDKTADASFELTDTGGNIIKATRHQGQLSVTIELKTPVLKYTQDLTKMLELESNLSNKMPTLHLYAEDHTGIFGMDVGMDRGETLSIWTVSNVLFKHIVINFA